jgi:hypothetical protein
LEREQVKEDASCDKVTRISKRVFRPEVLQDGGPRRNAEKKSDQIFE